MTETEDRILTPWTRATLLHHATRWAPREACGYLYVQEQDRPDGPVQYVVLVPNIAPDPTRAFEMDPACAPDDGWRDKIAWHSHPTAWARPSREDVRFMEITRAPMVIVSLKAPATIALYELVPARCGSRVRKVGEWRE